MCRIPPAVLNGLNSGPYLADSIYAHEIVCRNPFHRTTIKWNRLGLSFQLSGECQILKA
jgi:hypothetical protein